MRTAKVCLLIAVACFAAAAVGLATVWTGAIGSILLLTAATSAAIAMEARDFAEGRGLEAILEDIVIEEPPKIA
jgi:hypothetical protein